MNRGVEVKSFYYDEEDNIMIDEYGNVFYDIFRLISPSKFFLYKLKRGTYYIPAKGRDDVVYEFVFPLINEEGDDW